VGKPKPFDPRDPPEDRLPTMKIPRAKTDEEHQAVAQSREQMGDIRRSGLSSSSSASTTVSGVKRAAEEHDDNATKKPKITTDTMTSKKRKAGEEYSQWGKRTKLEMFMGYRKTQTAKKPEAGSRKGGNKHSPSSKFGPNGHRGAPIRRVNAESADVNAKDVEDKKDTSDDTANAQAVVKSAAAKRKAGEQGSAAAKKSNIENASDGEKSGGKAIIADTSKPEPQTESHPSITAKADRDDKAEQCEKDTKLGSLSKPDEKTSPSADDDNNRPSTMNENNPVDADAPNNLAQVDPTATRVEDQVVVTEDRSVDAEPPKNPAVVNANAARTEQPVTDAKPVDETDSTGEQALTDNATSEGAKKRKRDDDIAGPAKKPRLSSSAENSLKNYGQACFMNASLHLLHSVPTFAGMKNEDGEATKADNVLNKAEVDLASAGGQTRKKKDVRARLRRHLKAKTDSNEL
jgi:hypothetical protein